MTDGVERARLRTYLTGAKHEDERPRRRQLEELRH